MSKSRAEVNSYFHSEVDRGTGMSADYVVAHGRRQAQRGRKPSVRYKNLVNPRASLEAAQADVDARDATDDQYRADFCGRVALIRVWSDRQRQVAQEYANRLIKDSDAIGAIVQDVQNGETLQAPLHYRVTDRGTVELLLPM